MRLFKTECKDNKTGLSMVLSECSYNMAMSWLWNKCGENVLHRYGICKCATNKNGLIEIEVFSEVEHGKPRHIRTFFYDEERGYLLGE